jgi:hypothetical protein
MLKKMLLSILLFFFGLACGIFGERSWNKVHRVQEWSAMKSLDQLISVKMKEFKKEHGSYPETLSELEISYDASDGARPEMLKRFYYEKRGGEYILFWDETVYWNHTED